MMTAKDIDFTYAIKRSFASDRHKAISIAINFLRLRPIFLFHFSSLFLNFSISSLVLVPITFILSEVLVQIRFMSGAINQFKNVYSEIIQKFNLESVNFFLLNEVLDQETYVDINTWFIQPTNLPGMSRGLDDIVRVCQVDEEGKISVTTPTFSTPAMRSDIFISDNPHKLKGFRRFIFLHEIGHACMSTITNQPETMVGVVPYMGFMIWLIFRASWSAEFVVLFFALVCYTILWKQEINRIAQRSRLFSEMLADVFALGYMHKEEIEKLQEVAKKDLFVDQIYDKTLSSVHNSFRIFKMRESINLILQDKYEDALGSIFNNEDLNTPQLVSTLSSAIFLMLFSYYALPTTWNIVGIVSVVTLILLLYFNYLTSRWVNSSQEIDRLFRKDSKTSRNPTNI